MELREINGAELLPLLNLYTHLNENPMPQIDEKVKRIWDAILSDENHHIVVAMVDGTMVSSCVVLIVPNLTQGQKPYAQIENVVTHGNHRGKGYATAVLEYAKGLAMAEDCYKIMLMTGSKDEKVLRFYEHAGYNQMDKTAFVQWLGEGVGIPGAGL